MSKRKYTNEEKEFLKNYANGHSHKEILDEFNRRFVPEIKIGQLRSYLANNKILTGRTGYFEKGHNPYNKGIKRGSWGRMTETQFKKGDIPPQHKKVGSKRYDTRNDTLYIKVAEPNVWKSKQQIIWEQHNGVVPEGNIIIFLDGDKENYDIENLETIDRATNLILNRSKLRMGDKELTRTGIMTAKLIKEIQKKSKR